MTYVCELATGQHLYLDNRAKQTVLTLTSSSRGQQQQSSSSVETGVWTTSPEVFQTAQGIVVRIGTPVGDRLVQLQGNSISLINHSVALNSAQAIPVKPVSDMPSASPVQPMQPMEPMQPMNLSMGDMKMSMNPMQMQMGNMKLDMGSPAASASSTQVSSTQVSCEDTQNKRFCSQCGVAVDEGDRFCASCGHRLH
jgi:hypothetical protein